MTQDGPEGDRAWTWALRRLSGLATSVVPAPVRAGTTEALVSVLSPELVVARPSDLQAAAVLRDAPEFYVAIDEDGRVLEWNRAAEKLFGYTRAQVLGRPVHGLIVPPRSHAAHLAGVERFRTTGSGRGLDGPVEVEALHADGSTVTVQLQISAQHDEHGFTFHAFGHDVGAQREQRRALQLLAAHRQHLLTSADAAAVQRQLCQTAREALRCDSAYLYEIADRSSGGFLLRRVAQAVGLAEEGELEVPLLPSDAAVLLRDGRILVPDTSVVPKDRGDRFRAAGLGGAVLEALHHEGQLVGVLVLGWLRPRPTGVGPDHDVMALLAGEAALVLARLADADSLREAARTDGLTGLLNRRAFDEALPGAVERSCRAGEPCVLAMLDLDDFKGYNDRHGHPAGDVLLRQVAQAWRGALPSGAELFRFGGDEFALLLVGGSAEQVEAVVAALRGVTPAVTSMSVGWAALEDGEDVVSLLARADADLYARKRERRAG